MKIEKLIQKKFLRIALQISTALFAVMALLLLMLKGNYNDSAAKFVTNLVFINGAILSYGILGTAWHAIKPGLISPKTWAMLAALLFLLLLHNPLYPMIGMAASGISELAFINIASAIALVFIIREKFLKG